MNAVRCILMYHGSETLEHRFTVCWDLCDELLELNRIRIRNQNCKY